MFSVTQIIAKCSNWTHFNAIESLTFFFKTTNEGISRKTWCATTYGIMVHHVASGIYPTGTRTRILTFRVNTGLVLRTISTDNTFRSACWWSSYVIFLTRTNGMFIYHSTQTVWTTWRWYAWLKFGPLRRY